MTFAATTDIHNPTPSQWPTASLNQTFSLGLSAPGTHHIITFSTHRRDLHLGDNAGLEFGMSRNYSTPRESKRHPPPNTNPPPRVTPCRKDPTAKKYKTKKVIATPRKCHTPISNALKPGAEPGSGPWGSTTCCAPVPWETRPARPGCSLAPTNERFERFSGTPEQALYHLWILLCRTSQSAIAQTNRLYRVTYRPSPRRWLRSKVASARAHLPCPRWLDEWRGLTERFRHVALTIALLSFRKDPAR